MDFCSFSFLGDINSGSDLSEFFFSLVIFDNSINDIRNELIEFLRSELHNKKIDLRLIVSESESESKLYTSEEKFKHMLSKNEDLGKLKQEFNLDFE